jgi:carboxylesterase
MEWNEPIYHEGSGATGRTGVLVLHGFTGSPCSVQEPAGRFVEAGYTVALPLLTGHGRTPEALEKALWTDWTSDVEKAYAWLVERTDKVCVFGLSMGGALALWSAERHPEVAGLVLVNALLRHPQELIMRVFGRIGAPRWAKAVGNDIKRAGVDEKPYGRVPTRATRQLALLLAAVRADLGLVRCPVLLFSAKDDHVVPPANQREILAGVGSADKKMIELCDCYHVATMDNEKELIFAETLEFIARVTATKATGSR